MTVDFRNYADDFYGIAGTQKLVNKLNTSATKIVNSSSDFTRRFNNVEKGISDNNLLLISMQNSLNTLQDMALSNINGLLECKEISASFQANLEVKELLNTINNKLDKLVNTSLAALVEADVYNMVASPKAYWASKLAYTSTRLLETPLEELSQDGLDLVNGENIGEVLAKYLPEAWYLLGEKLGEKLVLPLLPYSKIAGDKLSNIGGAIVDSQATVYSNKENAEYEVNKASINGAKKLISSFLVGAGEAYITQAGINPELVVKDPAFYKDINESVTSPLLSFFEYLGKSSISSAEQSSAMSNSLIDGVKVWNKNSKENLANQKKEMDESVNKQKAMIDSVFNHLKLIPDTAPIDYVTQGSQQDFTMYQNIWKWLFGADNKNETTHFSRTESPSDKWYDYLETFKFTDRYSFYPNEYLSGSLNESNTYYITNHNNFDISSETPTEVASRVSNTLEQQSRSITQELNGGAS